MDEQPIKCQCGLWFATEKDLQGHLDRHKVAFLTIKRKLREVQVDFHTHGKAVK